MLRISIFIATSALALGATITPVLSPAVYAKDDGRPVKPKPEPSLMKFCPPNCPTPTLPDAPIPMATAPVHLAEPVTTAATPRPRLKRCGWVMLEKCHGEAAMGPRGIDPKSANAIVNIGTATRNDLKIIPGLSPQAITIITEENDKGDFSSIGDFGKRVCSRVSVDLSAVNAEIGGELFKGIGPKVPGFKCAAGDGSYEAAGIKKPLPWYAGGEPLKL